MAARAGAKAGSWARRIPLVLTVTSPIPLSLARRTKSRISGWMVGSPPENMTTSGFPSAATKASRPASTWARDREKPSGWWPESAKQMGQSRLQPVLISMIPRQACCLCSGQSPQSSGHPSATSVWKARGMVPGLLKRRESRYIPASEYTRASKVPWVGQRLRRNTLLSRTFTCPSTTSLQMGQMLLVYSR